ncbi:hypothetical protein O6H91_04G111500 [Diphasiastrum complanatum]|uniref:Uncharacterized protein n=1 Tax=Diphasiastrum complanatum TaxID=34168 RepID=A0ACC2E0R7_DIPCM|nr:hypothetical protein O6H91_04G111500 [Diphasiastrum complanatum]
MVRDAFALLWIGAALRFAFIVYGEWQDAHLEVPYTDIDYTVFSDAAAFMYEGKSPYLRDTYRYSPLLALLLLPNVCLHPSWGKFLFSAADLLVGYLILKLLQLQKVSQKYFAMYLATWLFNPYTFTIGRLVEAAIWYGVAVHFRIYPIIYVLPILLILSDNYVKGANVLDFSNVNAQAAEKHESVDNVQSSCSIANHGQDITSLHKKTHKSILGDCFHAAQCLNRHRIQFGLISGAVFFLLTGICYKLYGTDFLHEALLYHVTRTDPRHNFSIYFYYIYLHQNYGFSIIERLVAFIPQMFMQVVLAAYFFKDIPFCLFLQTVGFVAFNKVITAQYFVWFFCLLPLILPSISLKFKWKGALCMALWSGAQLHWLAWAYLLEFQGKNVFFQLWLASIIFFAANMFIISIFILSYSRNNTQLDSKTSLSIPAHHKKSE